MINTGPATDGLARELAALEAVARALAQLQDVESRARVLRWATERFDAPHPRSADAAECPAGDPTLSVDDLTEMFDRALPDDDDTLVVTPPVEPPAPRRPDVPLDSLVRSFAVDLRRAGQEWQRA